MIGAVSLLAQATSSTCVVNGELVNCSKTSGLAAGVFGIFILFYLALIALVILTQWKIFTKAGKPGWAAIVPVYNVIIMLELVGRPLWWVLLFFVPFVNFVVAIILAIDLAKSFGKDTGFGILLIFLPFIGYPMLAFGSAQYVGPAAVAVGTATPQAGSPYNPTNPTAPTPFPFQPTEPTPPVASPEPPADQTPPTQPPVV